VKNSDDALSVLQVLPALHGGGVEQGTVELATFLKDQGLASHVASSGGRLADKLTKHGVTHHSLPLASKNPVTILLNAFRLYRLVRTHHIDLLHVRSRAPAWSVLLCSRWSGIPFVTTFHGLYGHKNRAKRWYNSAMLKGVTTIAVSEFIAKHIQKVYPWATPPICIDRGIDPSYYDPDSNSLATQSKPDASFTLLFPARFTRLKGHELVLDALEELPPHSVRIIMVGSSEGKSHYLKELKQRYSNLKQDVQFLAAQPDLRALYKQADAVISATLKPESFGRTIIEAQAMKCLVLAPNHGTNPDIVAPELQAGLYSPNDATDLYRAIQVLMALDLNQREEMTSAGRQHVCKHFQLQQTLQKTLALYRQVVGK